MLANRYKQKPCKNDSHNSFGYDDDDDNDLLSMIFNLQVLERCVWWNEDGKISRHKEGQIDEWMNERMNWWMREWVSG